jgi:hypothetical protein
MLIAKEREAKEMRNNSDELMDWACRTLQPCSIPNPVQGDYHSYFHTYIQHVPEGRAGGLLVEQLGQMQDLFGRLTESESLAIHSPWTWSLRQVLGHLIDVERVFGYRFVRIASGDSVPLPGFDQNVLVDGQQFGSVCVPAMLEEWLGLRIANVRMIGRIPASQFANACMVDGHRMTASAAACVIVGHVEHHLIVVRKRVVPSGMQV